jgi:hypothetical protein
LRVGQIGDKRPSIIPPARKTTEEQWKTKQLRKTTSLSLVSHVAVLRRPSRLEQKILGTLRLDSKKK